MGTDKFWESQPGRFTGPSNSFCRTGSTKIMRGAVKQNARNIEKDYEHGTEEGSGIR